MTAECAERNRLESRIGAPASSRLGVRNDRDQRGNGESPPATNPVMRTKNRSVGAPVSDRLGPSENRQGGALRLGDANRPKARTPKAGYKPARRMGNGQARRGKSSLPLRCGGGMPDGHEAPRIARTGSGACSRVFSTGRNNERQGRIGNPQSRTNRHRRRRKARQFAGGVHRKPGPMGGRNDPLRVELAWGQCGRHRRRPAVSDVPRWRTQPASRIRRRTDGPPTRRSGTLSTVGGEIPRRAKSRESCP